MPPLTTLSTDHLKAVHNASLRLFEEYGIEVMSGHTLAIFQPAGAEVNNSTMIVRADRGLIMDALSVAPDKFQLTPTNPHRALTIGGDHIHFGMVSGTPNAHDIRGGRRTGNFAVYQKLIKLGQSFNVLYFFGTANTMERYKTAFHSSFLSDCSNNENWRDAGARTATERAMTL